jgi:hypothetical protein
MAIADKQASGNVVSLALESPQTEKSPSFFQSNKMMLLLRLWESGNSCATPKAAQLPPFPQPSFSSLFLTFCMAGFEVTLHGRIEVTPEAELAVASNTSFLAITSSMASTKSIACPRLFPVLSVMFACSSA